MSDKNNKELEKDLIDESDENILETEDSVKEFNLKDPKAKTVSSAEVLSEKKYADDWVISDDMDKILELEGEETATEIKDPAVVEAVASEKGEAEADSVAEADTKVKDEETDEEETSPIFKELAEPKLPELPKENRARLQMQSPTRLYFYWSVKNNPFQILSKIFKGNTGNYTLVTRLKNRTDGTEELFRVEPEGNWWFNVDADADYVAELGFYAPNRPFIRVMFSNEVRTPRKNPSKRRDYTPYFNVNAHQFAEVLDVAGYERDAFEVAFTGDDEAHADEATNKTYSQLTGIKTEDSSVRDGDEMRFVLLALASGHSLEEIRDEINPSLYDSIKSEIEQLSSENVLSALKENFDIFTDDIFEEEEIGDAIVGASLVNFPKRIKKLSVPQTLSPKITDKDLAKLKKFSPISSAEFPISPLSLKK